VLNYIRWEDIFLAYGRADGMEYARALATALATRCFTYYVDQWLAEPGQRAGPATIKARRRAHLLIVIASPAAAASPQAAVDIAVGFAPR
jgi:hypothetical protein